MTPAFSHNIISMMLQASLVVKVVLVILILFSIFSWAVIFTKWILLRRAKKETKHFLDLFYDSSELSKVYAESDDLTYSPLANLFKAGYSELTRTRSLQPNPASGDNVGMQIYTENLERILKKTLIHQSRRLEKSLSFLATTGNTTPFLGLFGTVWGIMVSFRGIGMKGSASLVVVAPGISEALISTVMGLAAAIPAVVAYNYFRQKIMELETEMESFNADFLGLIKRRFLKKKKTSPAE